MSTSTPHSEGGLHVQPAGFNLKHTDPASAAHVTILGPIDNQLAATGGQFVKDAPNLPFDLPFGLGKLFNLPGAQTK